MNLPKCKTRALTVSLQLSAFALEAAAAVAVAYLAQLDSMPFIAAGVLIAMYFCLPKGWPLTDLRVQDNARWRMHNAVMVLSALFVWWVARLALMWLIARGFVQAWGL